MGEPDKECIGEVKAVSNVVSIAQGEPILFDHAWILYPRKVAKLEAKKAWAKIDPRNHVAVLVALVDWRPVWKDKDQEFLPHFATWLRGERWEDELPVGFRRVTAESTQTGLKRDSSVSAPEIRSEIPAHVMSVLARLKAKL